MKLGIYISMIIAITSIVYGYYSFIYQFHRPDITTNCMSEVDSTAAQITSKDDFISFLKNNTIYGVWLDNYKDIQPNVNDDERESREIDWKRVLQNTQFGVVNLDWKEGIHFGYGIRYTPYSCDEFLFTMTRDGDISTSGCCPRSPKI